MGDKVKTGDQSECIPNIGPEQQHRRRSFGVAAFLVGGVATLGLALAPAPRWWRLPLFFLFFGGATGVFQAREQTCVALAALGQRNLDEGAEQIEDSAELAQIRRQARKVRIESTLLAAALTAMASALPVRR
jgi:hypothetical protein